MTEKREPFTATRQADAHVYLDQAADEIPFGPEPESNGWAPSWTTYRPRQAVARDKWIELREDSDAYIFYCGGGYCPLQVAVFVHEGYSDAEFEAYQCVLDYLREHRPDELDEDGELEECWCERIPAVVEDIE